MYEENLKYLKKRFLKKLQKARVLEKVVFINIQSLKLHDNDINHLRTRADLTYTFNYVKGLGILYRALENYLYLNYSHWFLDFLLEYKNKDKDKDKNKDKKNSKKRN